MKDYDDTVASEESINRSRDLRRKNSDRVRQRPLGQELRHDTRRDLAPSGD